MQSTLIKAVRNLSSFRAEAALFTWLCQTVTRGGISPGSLQPGTARPSREPALLESWGGDKPLRARFGDPPGTLGDGYRVVGRIIIWQAASVLNAPLSALFRCGSDWCVFLIDGHRARRRAVRLGHMSSTEAEVLAGRKANDLVVRHPPNELEDGAPLQLIRE